MASPIPLRRNRAFISLQLGQLLSTLGSGMSAIAYPLLALAVTHSAAKAGYVSAVVFVPLVLLSLVAGVTADRFDRRRQMIAADIVGALAVAVLGGLIVTGHATLTAILVVAFIDSSTSRFYSTASQGAFRAVVPAAQLPAAASAVQARAAVVRLGAPPLGGALFGIGRFLPFLVDAGSYAFSTGATLAVRADFQQSRERDPASLRRQLADGVSYFARMPFLRSVVTMIAVSNFGVAGTQFAIIVLAHREGVSSAGIGGFLALVGATTLLGSLASPLLQRVLSLKTIMLLELWAAVGYIAFLIHPEAYVLAIAFAAQASCFPNTDAAVSAYSLALIPDRLLGRAMATENTLRAAAAPLGPLVAGLLLADTTPRLTVAVLMGTTLAAALLGTFGAAMRHPPPLVAESV